MFRIASLQPIQRHTLESLLSGKCRHRHPRAAKNTLNSAEVMGKASAQVASARPSARHKLVTLVRGPGKPVTNVCAHTYTWEQEIYAMKRKSNNL